MISPMPSKLFVMEKIFDKGEKYMYARMHIESEEQGVVAKGRGLLEFNLFASRRNRRRRTGHVKSGAQSSARLVDQSCHVCTQYHKFIIRDD